MRTPPGFSPWTALLVGAIAAGGVIATVVGTRRQQARGVERASALRRSAGWSAVVGSGLAIPLVTLSPTGGVELGVHLVPLEGTAEVLRISGDPAVVARIVGLNVALFVPLGAGVALLRSRRGVLAAGLAGAGVSGLVELAQWLVPTGRVTDVDDVLLNATGAVLGGLLVRAVDIVTDPGADPEPPRDG